MNYHIRFIVVFFWSMSCFFSVHSQNLLLNPLSANDQHEYLHDVIIVHDSIIAYSVSDPFITGDATIRVRNVNSGITFEYTLGADNEAFEYSFNSIIYHGETIYFIGLFRLLNYEDSDGGILLTRFELESNEFSTDTLISDFSWPGFRSVRLNIDNNLVILGAQPFIPTQFIFEFSLGGSFIKSQFYPELPSAMFLISLPDHSYRLSKDGGYMLHLDNDFNIIANYSATEYFPTEYGIVNATDGTTFWRGGTITSSALVNNNVISTPVVKIGKYTLDDQFNSYVIDTVEQTYQDFHLLAENISGLDESKMYLAINYDIATFLGWGGYSIIPKDDATLKLYALDSQPNIVWEAYLGGDANYNLRKVLATPDSGCIVFANRYDPHLPETGIDAYYLKLDKYGNPQPGYLDTYTNIDTTPAMPLAQLRYDITTQALYLPTDIIGGSYRLYHSNGALLESFTATGYRIGLDKWPAGLYLYDYTAPDGQRYRGKVVLCANN